MDASSLPIKCFALCVANTSKNIEMLAERANVDDAIANCGGVVTVKPFIEQDGEKRFLRIQADAGYGDPREDITNGM